MACLNCGNCKQGDVAYFCFDKNEFIVNEEVNNRVIEKTTRIGWKKGDPEYELHRRKSRKEVEA
jgi:hypothetical protein